MNISSFSSGVAAYETSKGTLSSTPNSKPAPKLDRESDGDQDDSAILKAAIATQNSKAATSLIGQNLNELA